MAFLAGVSGALRLGTEICAHPLTGFVVPGNLFVITVGRSGQKKTALMNLFATEPLSGIGEKMERDNELKEEKSRYECRGRKKDERPPKPRKLYSLIHKYTGEALASQLQALEKEGLGLLMCRDEISGLFASFNQYKGGAGNDLQQLLEAYDGGGSTELRASTEDRHYPKCHVGVYGNIQPDVLDSLVIEGGVNDADGKWARAIFSPLPQITKPLPAAFTPEQEEAYRAAAALLKSVALQLHLLPPTRYMLDSEARARFVEYELLMQQQAQAARHKAHASLYGESAGKVARLSLLIFLLRRTEDPSLGRTFSEYCIALESLNRAIDLVDDLDSWAFSRHELIATNGRKDVGRLRLIHGIAEKKGGWVSWKEVRESIHSDKRKQHQCTATTFGDAVRELVELELGEVQASGPRGAVRYRATRSLPGAD